MCAHPETYFICSDGETVDFDGDEVCGGGGGAELVLADFEVVVCFHAEFVGEEGAVVDGAAGFEDEVFKEEVDFWDGDFNPGDGDILDRLDEKGKENVDGVVEEFMIGCCVAGNEDVDDFTTCGDESGDVGVFDHGAKRNLGLSKGVVDVFAEVGLGIDLMGLVTEFLDFLIGRFEKVGVCQEFLDGVANIHHEALKLGIFLRVAHHLVELLFEQFPLSLVTKGGEQRPEVTDGPVKFGVGVNVLLSSTQGLIRGS